MHVRSLARYVAGRPHTVLELEGKESCAFDYDRHFPGHTRTVRTAMGYK